ncbi:MAG: HlyD family efflux transporter periplasmic adaptor subunit [Verrucomicrobia bacterium]|nr:MAG: HlyD family efflux transporter periplasmic adaptor subunit [Verrucomicrobiota bacterium]
MPRGFPSLLLALLFAGSVAGCRRDDRSGWASGTVESDVVRVGSRHGGRIVRLAVREGDAVRSGQLIAELEAPELPALREQAAAQLAELEAGARPEELAVARAELAAIRADAELADADVRRVRRLAKEGVATPSELDRGEARSRSAGKSLAAAQSRLDLLLAGTRRERLLQARARLRELDAHLGELRVVAPTNAVVETLPAKEGDLVAPNREVATLLPSGRLWVRVYVPQPWIGHLHPGDSAEVRADAFPERVFKGRVDQVAREAEFTPRNVQTPAERVQQVFGIKIALPAEDGALRAGMSVDARFPGVPAETTGRHTRP